MNSSPPSSCERRSCRTPTTPVRSTRPPRSLRHQLHAVADAERRDPELEDARVDLRRARRRRPRPARRTERAPADARANLLRTDPVRDELRVDPALAHPPRDQLRVLASGGPERAPAALLRPAQASGSGTTLLIPIPIFWASLERLALGLDRRREHDLGLLEVVDRLVAAGRHRRPERAHQVQRPVVLARGADDDLLERGVLVDLDARAARQRRVERRHPPVEAAAGRLLRARERRADHHRVGAAGDRLRRCRRRCACRRRRSRSRTCRSRAGAARARAAASGDRRRLRDADAEDAARSCTRAPGPTPTSTPSAPVRIRCSAVWYEAQPPTITGIGRLADELLQVQRLPVRGHVLGRDDGALDDEACQSPASSADLVVLAHASAASASPAASDACALDLLDALARSASGSTGRARRSPAGRASRSSGRQRRDPLELRVGVLVARVDALEVEHAEAAELAERDRGRRRDDAVHRRARASGSSSRCGPSFQPMSTSCGSRVRRLGTIAMSSKPYACRAFLPLPISTSTQHPQSVSVELLTGRVPTDAGQSPECKKPRLDGSPGPENHSLVTPLKWQSIVPASGDDRFELWFTSTPPAEATRLARVEPASADLERRGAAGCDGRAERLVDRLVRASRAARKAGQEHVAGTDGRDRSSLGRPRPAGASPPAPRGASAKQPDSCVISTFARAELGDRRRAP